MESFARIVHHLLREITRRIENLERIQYLKIIFLFLGFAVIWTTFKYTVLEHQYYRTLADKQQTIIVKNPVSR